MKVHGYSFERIYIVMVYMFCFAIVSVFGVIAEPRLLLIEQNERLVKLF